MQPTPDITSGHIRRICLFGALRIQTAQGPLNLTGNKAQSLLAYLALHPRTSHRREALAEILFPSAPPARARKNVTDTLHRLRKTLGEGWLLAEGDTLAFVASEDVWVDVGVFDTFAASDQPTDWQHALALYTGDLLPEIYDDWILPARELRRTQFGVMLEKLASQFETQGELQPALLHTRRLILAEPLHEPAHQNYLRLLGRLRRYGEALAHYDDLRQLLKTELHAEPMAETRALVRALERERDVPALPAEAEEQNTFVGRTAERAAALASVEGVLSKRGSLLAIEGEAGMGKSRLAREIVAGARWRGLTVVQGGVSEVPDASPFSPLSHALAPLFNSPRAAQLETLLPNESLAALAPLHPAWGARSPAAPASMQQTGRQFYGALRALGATLAQLMPLAVVLDDVQWASPTLWESLQAFGQGLLQQGGLLLLIYRRPEIEHTFGWQVLQSWDRAGLLRTLSLLPLNPDEVAQFVQGHTHIHPLNTINPNEAHALTGGNPFLMSEWLTEPVIEPPMQRYRTVTAQRLQALAAPARMALESAAVLGENIPYRLWADVADATPLALAALSEKLATQRWLQPSAAGYAFAHDLVRQTVYDDIEPSRRRALHAQAARAYQTREPDNARSRAFHFDRAELPAEAAAAHRQAGEQDLARFAFREAQTALHRALVLMPTAITRERVQTALALAQACENTGDREHQQPALAEALAGARHLQDEALLLQGLLVSGYALEQIGQFDAAEAHLTEALALATQLQNHAEETYAVFLLGDCCIQRGQWPAAQARFAQTLALAQAHANPSLEGRALRGLAMAVRQMGAPHESLTWFEKAIAVHRQANDRWSEMVTQANLLSTYYDLGAWDQLIAAASALMPMAEGLGDYARTAVVQHLQGLAAYSLGDYAEARRLLAQSEQVYAAGGQRRMAGLLRNTLGLVADDEGDDDEALRCYRAALESALALQASTEAAYAQHDLGALLVRLEQPLEAIPLLEASRAAWTAQQNVLLQVKSEAFLGLALLMAGEQARAAEWAEASWAVFEAGVPVGEQPQGWLWAFYRLLIALGSAQHERARAVLRAAYAELQRQAQAIGDAVLRRSFFERVPLNRAIVAAHDQMTDAPGATSVALARRGVPLGRSLRADEFVTVQWTLHAPDDEVIADKAKRRQHRLQRLLREAEAQGAAPTDDDLADALGVSRRTILRDMQAMGRGQAASTRKRKIG